MPRGEGGDVVSTEREQTRRDALAITDALLRLRARATANGHPRAEAFFDDAAATCARLIHAALAAEVKP